MRYNYSFNSRRGGYTLLDRKTGMKSKNLQLQTDAENYLPVIKLEKSGKLLYSNLASLPLLSFWGALDLKNIPLAFLNSNPQIFNNSEMEITLPYKSELFHFHRELSADENVVTLVMLESFNNKQKIDQNKKNKIQASFEISAFGIIEKAVCVDSTFLGIDVKSIPGSSIYSFIERNTLDLFLNPKSDIMFEHLGSELEFCSGSSGMTKVNAEIFIVRDTHSGDLSKIYLNLKPIDLKIDYSFELAYKTGAFVEFRKVFNLLSNANSIESIFDSLAGYIDLCLGIKEIAVYNFKSKSWIYPKNIDDNISLELSNISLPVEELGKQRSVILNISDDVQYLVIPAETTYALSHCLCIKISSEINPDDAVIDLINLLFTQTIIACSRNILGLDEVIEKDDLYEILNNLQDTFYRTSSDGSLSMINNSVTDLLGYLPEEVRGVHIKKFYCNDEEHAAIRATLKENKSIKNKRISMRHKDGHEVQVILNARALYDNNGEFLGSEGIMHDATELISKEASLRAMFESNFRSIISVDKTFNINAINDRARAQLKDNLNTEVKVGESVRNLFRSREFYDLNISIVKAFKGEQGKLQQVFVVKDKGRVWYKMDLIPIINPNKKIDEILIIAENITELKQKESEISRLYKALDENPNEVYIFDDCKYKVLYANEGGIRNLGYSRDTIRDLYAWDFMMKYSKSTFAQLVEKLKSGESSELRFETKHKNNRGKIYPVEVHLTLNETEGSKTIVCIAIDISSRKKQEFILRKKNKELEKVNFELDRFVYSASHDLKAPLRSVLGLISIARKEITEEHNQVYFDMMNKSIHKLDGFISDMIDYSRNTRLELDHQKIDMKCLLDETLDNLRYHEGTGMVDVGIDLKMKCDFISDPKRIGIILNNVCSNSVKYRDDLKDKPYLNIRIDCDHTRALIIVKDNGIGIRKEDHKKIFAMFYRSSVKSYGSGLGLYIVNEIIDKLSGTIQVVSEPGIGTEFIIQIPNKLKNNTFVDEFGLTH